MYHFTPLTCCTTILEKEEGEKQGRGVIEVWRLSHLHTWYWLLCNKFSDIFFPIFICSNPQVYVVWTCWSTTIVWYFKRVLSHMGGPIKAEKKGGEEKELTSQSKIWESISSVSILKWEKSSGWRWMILRRWRIEVCWTAPWFFNLWINSRVFGRKSEKRSVDLAMRRNSPTIAE